MMANQDSNERLTLIIECAHVMSCTSLKSPRVINQPLIPVPCLVLYCKR